MPVYEYPKNGKTHYYYAFEVKDHNGKRKTIKKRGFTGITIARNEEAKARTAWLKGSYIDPTKITFGEYITAWLKNKTNLSPETRETNEGHLKNHIKPVIGHIPLQKVTADHILEMIRTMKDKGLADGTSRKIYNLVQTCFRSAARKGLIIKNPFDQLDKGDKPKASKPKINYWTTNEVKHFFKVLNHRQKILFVLAIYCGMRRGEILGLRWKDVDFKNSQIRIVQTLKPRHRIKDGGKTHNAMRSISVSPYVMSELKRHRKMIMQEKLASSEYHDMDLVLCQPNGNPVSVSNFSKFWKKIVEDTEMRYIRFHDLRHTCASLHLSINTHPQVVKELLGHSSIKVTLDTYSHLMPNMHSEAAIALEKTLNEQ